MSEYDVTLALIVEASNKTAAHRMVREWLDELEYNEGDYKGMRSVEITPAWYPETPAPPPGGLREPEGQGFP